MKGRFAVSLQLNFIKLGTENKVIQFPFLPCYQKSTWSNLFNTISFLAIESFSEEWILDLISFPRHRVSIWKKNNLIQLHSLDSQIFQCFIKQEFFWRGFVILAISGGITERPINLCLLPCFHHALRNRTVTTTTTKHQVSRQSFIVQSLLA